MLKRHIMGLLALAFLVLIAPLSSRAAPFGNPTGGIGQKVASCDINYAGRCLTVTSGGSVLTGALQAAVAVSPTVTASSAYASGNSVGGLITFTGAVLGNGGTGMIQKAVLNFKSTQTAQTDLVIFSANPSSTTIADKTAFSLNTADFDKVLAVIHLSDCTNLGTPSACQAVNLALPVQAAAGSTSLFGALVTRGTPTFTATSDVKVTIQVLQDK